MSQRPQGTNLNPVYGMEGKKYREKRVTHEPRNLQKKRKEKAQHGQAKETQMGGERTMLAKRTVPKSLERKKRKKDRPKTQRTGQQKPKRETTQLDVFKCPAVWGE